MEPKGTAKKRSKRGNLENVANVDAGHVFVYNKIG